MSAKLPSEFSDKKDVVNKEKGETSYANVKLEGHKEITEKNKNLNPELNEKDAKRFQSKLGNLRDQQAKFYINKEGEFKNLTQDEGIEKNSTIFFAQNKKCIYTVKATSTKILIEYCEGCTFIFAGQLMTSTVEMYNCKDCRVEVRTDVHTLQADVCTNLKVHFQKASHFYQIVHAALQDFHLTFEDSKEEVKTGLNELKKDHHIPEDREKITQFLTRVVNGKLLTEKAVRLPNGQITTQREKDEFDDRARKNEKIYMEKAEEMLKKVNTKKFQLYNQNHQKQGRNDKCQCGSGKKYKNCCINKKPSVHENNNNNNSDSKSEE